KNGVHPIIHATVAAELDHHWVKSGDYPKHEIAQSDFEDALGHGRQITVTSTGLAAKPNLVYALQLYDSQPFGEIRIEIQNRTDKTLTVQNLRSVEALGEPTLDLGATASADRVLSDSFSEDWPALRIYDLGTTPKEAPQSGMHRAVGSQLIYNRQSQQSIF